MNVAKSVVKCQTGDSTEEQRRRVDDVGGKVENLGQLDRRHVEDILDVFKVSTRTQVDELDAHTHEGDVARLDEC